MARVLIAGGGIAGMAAALALARADWDVTICERAPVPGEVGAGLQIGPNAARVLDWLGLLPRAEAVASLPQAAVLRDGLTGRVFYRMALGPAAVARWGAPYLHLHRAELLNLLVDAARDAGVALRLATTVERAVEHPDGISLHLAGGKVLEGDLALGADGIRSSLRTAINPEEAPRATGQFAWRALVPADRVPAGTIPRDATVWVGAGRHLVTYYVRGGALINIVAVFERRDEAEERWDITGDPEALREAYLGWAAPVTALLGAVDNCFVTGLYDRPEQARWTRGRLALIGDAAHPMLPFMAQGATQALEDVAVLVRCLEGQEVPAALQAWEAARWPRATRVQQLSRANGGLFHRPPGPHRSLERTLIGTVGRLFPRLAAGRFDWLYGYDPTREAL